MNTTPICLDDDQNCLAGNMTKVTRQVRDEVKNNAILILLNTYYPVLKKMMTTISSDAKLGQGQRLFSFSNDEIPCTILNQILHHWGYEAHFCWDNVKEYPELHKQNHLQLEELSQLKDPYYVLVRWCY